MVIHHVPAIKVNELNHWKPLKCRFLKCVCFCALVRCLWWFTSTLLNRDISRIFHRECTESLWAVLVVRGAWSQSFFWVDLWIRNVGRRVKWLFSQLIKFYYYYVYILNCGFLFSALHGFFTSLYLSSYVHFYCIKINVFLFLYFEVNSLVGCDSGSLLKHTTVCLPTSFFFNHTRNSFMLLKKRGEAQRIYIVMTDQGQEF